MFVIDDFEHEGEEGAEDFVAVLEVEAHVERLDVGKILQQVEVSEKKNNNNNNSLNANREMFFTISAV